MKRTRIPWIIAGAVIGTGAAILFFRRTGITSQALSTDIDYLHSLNGSTRINTFSLPLPPSNPDNFISLPGRMSVESEPPPSGTYCRLTFGVDATNANARNHPQRILVKQGGVLSGRTHTGGRVIDVYMGDNSTPTRQAFFTSDGGDIYFEFQEYHGRWGAYPNGIAETGDATNRKFRMSGARGGVSGYLLLEYGPDVKEPIDDDPAVINYYLWVDGKVECTKVWPFPIIGKHSGFAWITTTPDRSGPRAAVPRITVRVNVPCRGHTAEHTELNSNSAGVRTDFRPLLPPVPVCCDIEWVRAEAILPDGRVLGKDGGPYRP